MHILGKGWKGRMEGKGREGGTALAREESP